MTSARLVLRGSLALAIALGGCSNGGGYDSGVDDSKQFDSITDAEARIACENLGAYVQRNIPEQRDLELGCIVGALQSTVTPADCRAAVDACLAGTPTPFLGFAPDCETATATTDCDASVGEVEQCITADLGQIFGRLDDITCDIAGDVDALMELQMEGPEPVECTSLGDVCPQLADGFT